MNEKSPALSSLRVPRDFHFADRKIADASKGGGRLPSTKCGGNPPENKVRGATDVRKARMQVEWQHERIRKTTWSLQHGPATAHSPKNGDVVSLASVEMHVIGRPGSTTEHHERTLAFPKSQHRISAMLIQLVQQGFVEGEIFGRGRQGQIEQAEWAHVMSVWR
jgi:hypothetical protein